MNLLQDKRWRLFFVAAGCCVLLLYKVWPVSMTPTIRAVISKQRENIKSVAQVRNIASTKTFYFDSISFPEADTLTHTKLGPLGFSNDFFIDIEARFKLHEARTIEWVVQSDDGFRLSIDGQVISEFLGDRPYAATSKQIALGAGLHNLQLTYFQGYGKLGLRATYAVDSGSPMIVGQSGAGVEFEQFATNSPK